MQRKEGQRLSAKTRAKIIAAIEAGRQAIVSTQAAVAELEGVLAGDDAEAKAARYRRSVQTAQDSWAEGGVRLLN